MKKLNITAIAEKLADITDELFTKVTRIECENVKLKEQLRRAEAMLLSCSKEMNMQNKGEN